MSENVAPIAPMGLQPPPQPLPPPPPLPPDPDLELTQREFIDYTEYLPSDVYRYLRLYRTLDESARKHDAEVDALLQEYQGLTASLSTLKSKNTHGVNGGGIDVAELTALVARPGPPTTQELLLRQQISRNLNAGIKARKESAAEAERLADNVTRHESRLVAILQKLSQITLPSRDPSPVSPKPKRVRDEDILRRRIILRVPETDGATSHRRRAPLTTPGRRRARGIEDDWEDVEGTPLPRRKDRRRKSAGAHTRRGPKLAPVDPLMSGGAPSRKPDGTLIPKDELPWNQLTNEELARLRKRMKKNSGWTPSVTMIIRELESLGRGPKNRHKFEQQWKDQPEKFVGPEDGGIGNPSTIPPPDPNTGPDNKGMKLNRLKKRKREEERAADGGEKSAMTLEAERRRRQTEAATLAKAEIAAEKRRVKAALAAEEAAKAEAARQALEAERIAAEEQRIAAEREAAEKAAAKAAAEKAEAERIAAEKKAAAERAAAKEATRAAERAERAAAAAAERASASRSAAAAQKKTTRSSSGASGSSRPPFISAHEVEKFEDSSDDDDPLTEPEDEDEDMPDAPPAGSRSRSDLPKKRLGRPPKNVFTAKSTTTMVSIDRPSGERRSTRQLSSNPPPPPPPLPTPRTTRAAQQAASPPAARKRSISAKPPRRVPGGRRKKIGGAVGEGQEGEDEDKTLYCICNKPAGTELMVECENGEKGTCPKQWFHVRCVGMTPEEADSKEVWYCPVCAGTQYGKRGGVRRVRRGKA